MLTPRPGDPREWDPNHPSLFDSKAPHEVGAVLRMIQHRVNGPDVAKRLKISKKQAIHEMRLNLDDQQDAAMRKVPIYNDTVVICRRCGAAMMPEGLGKTFRCPVDNSANYNASTEVQP